MMDSCKLSPAGPTLSRLVYGTWRILDEDSKSTADQLAQRFEACLELGMDTLDTAEIYGNYGVEAAMRIRAAMDAMRERYDNAPDEALALAWVLAHPSQPVGIIGTNKLERIQTTARAADVRLDRQDWYTLWEAAQGRSVP